MKIYWDIQNHLFLESLTNSQAFQQWDWILRDIVPVELYIVTPDDATQAYIQQETPAGFGIRFSAKVSSATFAGVPLIAQADWTLSGTGTTAKYTGSISLNTAELIQAVGVLEYLDIIAEFSFEDLGGVQRDSTQLTLRIKPDVHRTGDATPAAYAPFLEFFTDSVGKECLRIKNTQGETLITLPPAGGTGI
jgi:hypothetical protein